MNEAKKDPDYLFNEDEISLIVGILENDAHIGTQEELRAWLKFQKHVRIRIEEHEEEMDERSKLDPDDPNYIPF